MSSKLIFVALCIFGGIFAEQHCHFEYHSYHVGEDFRESRKNFTTELQQNCGEGKFLLKIMLRRTWKAEEIENLKFMLGIYLNKLLDHRPDEKTSVDINEIHIDEVEIDHELLTKVTVEGECMERVLNWEMRCQVNLVFVIDSFRTNDLMKFEEFVKVEDETVEVPVELTLAPLPDIVDWDNLYSRDMVMMSDVKEGQADVPITVEEVKDDYMFTTERN